MFQALPTIRQISDGSIEDVDFFSGSDGIEEAEDDFDESASIADR